MGSEAMQITIPDFDEDEYLTPVPFGRPAAGGHGLFASPNPGQESPTLSSTPLQDRQYFHSRGDSITSEDSGHSIRHASRKHSIPFGHSAQSSIATSSSAFAKKSSFASLRNAFKTGKTSDAPPVPTIDHHVYPAALKNPFSRSTSSLAQIPPPSPPYRRPSIIMSPNLTRAPTPGSNESMHHARGVPSRSRSHAHARSQHSYSGSLFHSSDTGSDIGHGHSFNPLSFPPPVPPVPNAFGASGFRTETPPLLDYDDKVVMDPRTPSDYALHAIFIRFASSAEMKIDIFLKQPLNREPPLPEYMGPGVDSKFDDLLESLGRIAEKHTKPVLDSIMRWRRSHNEAVSSDVTRRHLTQSPALNRGIRSQDASFLLNERRSLAAIYIMCRALIAVVQSLSKDALGEATGYSLEETMFDQFKKPDLKLLAQSTNHRCNAELYAKLLGLLANVRFISVTDRFLAELRPVSSGQVQKDLDMKYENLVRGLKHIQIKVWPSERFEEGAEFLESLSKSFENTHGVRFKSAFAETLVELLHPIGKNAGGEVNDPQWAKAIKTIFPKVKDMVSKPRYWIVAYPLFITSLCVAPLDYFLHNWTACFEASLHKLKEKPARVPVMNGIMRLIWTYCYRCNEPSSVATAKLENLLRHFFPSHRSTIFPHDDRLESFVYILHFVLSRHFEFGTDFCLELLNEHAIRNSQSTNIAHFLAPERISVAIQAILLSLNIIEKDEQTPAWPASSDFSIPPSRQDMEMPSDIMPSALSSHAGVKNLMDRCGPTLALIAASCANSVGNMLVMDDQWSYTRISPSYEEAHNYITRRHPEGTVAYPIALVPQINVLKLCFQSWPRCLHPSLPFNDALDMLIRGAIHVEPMIRDVAELTLKRFMADPEHASALLARFAVTLFDPASITHEGSGVRLVIECTRLLNLWANLVDGWIHSILAQSSQSISEDELQTINIRLEELEAGALFLLSNVTPAVFTAGVKIIRMLGLLSSHFSVASSRVINLLHGKGPRTSYLYGFEDALEESEMDRLEQWRQSKRVDIPLRITASDDIRDRILWDHIFPSLIQSCLENPTPVLIKFREKLVAAATRYHPIIALAAGLNSRPPRATGTGDKDTSKLATEHRHHVDQWCSWVKIICATASVSDSRPVLNHVISANTQRDHGRIPSDANFDRERMATSRGLFRYLTPFLDAEHSVFRTAAVLCISSLPPHGYSHLLEDLNSLAQRQFFDEARSKSGQLQPAAGRTRRHERFYTAVTRIYFLTSHLSQDQRSCGRQAALAHVLKFVRKTQIFLTSPENRDLYTLQRLRRYFCGTVERVFDGLATLKDSDRFIPPKIHLSLYNLCEEWCQFGKQSDSMKRRLVIMQKAAATTVPESHLQAEAIERFQTETKQLSAAAVGALASLCKRAFFPPEVSSGSPTDIPIVDQLKALEAGPTLDRLNAILASYKPTIQALGKKTLKSLLANSAQDTNLANEALRRAYVSTRELDTSNARFFEVVADVISSENGHGFTFSQAVCLGLSNLCHPTFEIRRQAFNMLERIHENFSGILSLAAHEAAIGSSTPTTYLYAHRLISDMLAGEHPTQAADILSQFTDWLPRIHDSSTITITLLQSLEYWASSINLMVGDKTQLSRAGRICLYHLLALTLRFSESHPEQILVLWTRLVDSPHEFNGQAAVKFLLEHSRKVGSTVFISCAAKVVACLSQSVVGREVFKDLCDVIAPGNMLPNIEHKLAPPDLEEMELWSDLDVLFSEQPRQSLGDAQFALLFLSDVALERQWQMEEQLPVLLHALVAHLDHRIPYLRSHARHMLFQLLRSWAPGYDELPDRSLHPNRAQIKSLIDNLEQEANSMIWTEDSPSHDTEPKMEQFCSRVLRILTPLHPKLSEQWGSIALTWGTACSIRAIAFRSLQIFRALMPRVTKSDLALLLGRLSNTIASADEHIQLFTVEIILTLRSSASSKDLDKTLMPQLFWCAYACLCTTVEKEFSEVVSLFDVLLSRIDLDDPHTVELLTSTRPSDWMGPSSLQSSLLMGMRSSVTSSATLKLVQRLGKVRDRRLIDDSDGRVRDLYTLLLPWCLRDLIHDSGNESLHEFALDVASLAESEGRHTISRILNSYVKRRFRTNQDFMRESVATLREHYGADHWTEVITLLMGFVLNKEPAMKVHSMQILKVLFQQREARNPVELSGSELLMPLLRLLETDLAPQALEVLDEPVAISGGLAAKHVLRMSMHVGAHANDKELESESDIFGIPQESGWCVPRPDVVREICRHNVIAVFDTCKVPSRPSRIDFEPEDMLMMISADRAEDDLGDLVQNLHELSTFFQEPSSHKLSLPNRRLEARVAAILAKSVSDAPQTPFVDVFQVAGMANYDDSYDDSDSDTESDLFEYDSPHIS